MLIDLHGDPLTSEQTSFKGGRRGSQVDGFRMSDGAIISERISRDLHSRIRNDSVLRERIAQADKESFELRHKVWERNGKVGKEPKMEETLHLALIRLDNDEMTDAVRDAAFKNQAFGEKLQNTIRPDQRS